MAGVLALEPTRGAFAEGSGAGGTGQWVLGSQAAQGQGPGEEPPKRGCSERILCTSLGAQVPSFPPLGVSSRACSCSMQPST